MGIGVLDNELLGTVAAMLSPWEPEYCVSHYTIILERTLLSLELRVIWGTTLLRTIVDLWD